MAINHIFSALSTDFLFSLCCAFGIQDYDDYKTNNLGYGIKTEDGLSTETEKKLISLLN